MALLTPATLNAITPLGPNAEASVARLIDEVEGTQLRDLIGAPFLQAVQDDPSAYTDLLDGVKFLDASGRQISHRGLRFVLAYMVKAEYVTQSAAIDTATGYVFKKRNEADPIDTRARRDLTDAAKRIAMSEFSQIELYLRLNSTMYPLFNVADKVDLRRSNYRNLRKRF